MQCVRPPGHDAHRGPRFAQYQPFTSIIDTLRGLLMGAPIGNSAIIAIAWCIAIALAGYLWARTVFNRGPAR